MQIIMPYTYRTIVKNKINICEMKDKKKRLLVLKNIIRIKMYNIISMISPKKFGKQIIRWWNQVERFSRLKFYLNESKFLFETKSLRLREDIF